MVLYQMVAPSRAHVVVVNHLFRWSWRTHDELIRDLPATSFGTDCVYDGLEKAGASICNICVVF